MGKQHGWRLLTKLRLIWRQRARATAERIGVDGALMLQTPILPMRWRIGAKLYRQGRIMGAKGGVLFDQRADHLAIFGYITLKEEHAAWAELGAQ